MATPPPKPTAGEPAGCCPPALQFVSGDTDIAGSELGSLFTNLFSDSALYEPVLCTVGVGEIVGLGSSSGDLFASTDYGDSWSMRLGGFTDPSVSAPLLVYADGPEVLMALDGYYAAIAPTDKALWYSFDKGATLGGSLEWGQLGAPPEDFVVFRFTDAAYDGSNLIVVVGSLGSSSGERTEVAAFNVSTQTWDNGPYGHFALYLNYGVHTGVTTNRTGDVFILGFYSPSEGGDFDWQITLSRKQGSTWDDLGTTVEAAVLAFDSVYDYYSGRPVITTDAINFGNDTLLLSLVAYNGDTASWDSLTLRSLDNGDTWTVVAKNLLPTYTFVGAGDSLVSVGLNFSYLHSFVNNGDNTWVYAYRGWRGNTFNETKYSFDNGLTWATSATGFNRIHSATYTATTLPH